MASSERVFKLLDTPPEIVAPPAPRPSADDIAEIVFDHVWFAYKDEDWILRDVSFTIAPGETIAVVGHTGAGKTTLISLLLRFYDVQKAQSAWARRPPRVRSARAAPPIRRGVARSVPVHRHPRGQHPTRHGGHHARSYGARGGASESARLHSDAARGLRTQHPRARRWTLTGQKQLIGFARALAHNPRYLILDEATSSVDTPRRNSASARRSAAWWKAARRSSSRIASRRSSARAASS